MMFRCRRSAAAWLLGSRVRIPLGVWMFVLYLYVVLSCVGRDLCDGLITRPGESYRVCNCVIKKPQYAVEKNLSSEEIPNKECSDV
jgi:hypothetical protein